MSNNTGLLALSYLTANLASARNPVLASGGYDPTAIPSNAGGAAIDQCMVADAHVTLRLSPWYRTAYVDVTTVDLAATYTVTVAGTAVASAGPSVSKATLLTRIATDINADATVGLIVTADVFDFTGAGDGSGDMVRLVGKAGTVYRSLSPTTWSIAASAGGTGAVAVYADAEAAEVLFYRLPLHSATGLAGDAAARSTGWKAIAAPTASGLARYTVGPSGWTTVLDVRGSQRVVGLLIPGSVAGPAGDSVTIYLVRVDITPCAQESST
jgi:hypothetical protein